MNGRNPNYDREMTAEEKIDLERFNKYLNKPNRSQHEFSDGIRRGILSDGVTHENIIELIRKHKGDELANKYKAMKPATSVGNLNYIYQIVLYYQLAAIAVLHEFQKEGETCLHSMESWIDNPYGAAAIANSLYHKCKLYTEAFERRYKEGGDKEGSPIDDETMLWFSSELLQVSQEYCKMQISLLERSALLKMGTGAAERSSDNLHSYRVRTSLALAREYIDRKKLAGRTATYRSVTAHVKSKYTPKSDEAAPSRNTLISWLQRENIFL